MFKNTIKRVHSGFTLAEVLITLGIIGVVAAMTMPTLMNATNGAQYKTAYKKALSVISQAIVLNLALDDYDLGDTVKGTTDAQSLLALLTNRANIVRTETGPIDGYTPRINVDAEDAEPGSGSTTNLSGNYTVFFNDGIMFTFDQDAEGCTEENAADVKDSEKGKGGGVCRGFIDVNGTKAPNRQTACTEETADLGGDCIVDSPADIYPVVFYDQGIYPATAAGKAVLYKK